MKKPDFATLTLAPALDCTLRIDGALRAGGVHKVAEEETVPGGKGVNAALALAARGFRVAAGGLLGADNCEPFELLLERSGIEDRFLQVPGETRRNLMLLDGRSEYKINRPAFAGSLFSDQLPELLARLGRTMSADTVVLCGSLPADFPADTYERLITYLRAGGIPTVLDTSGEALRCGARAAPEVIKPNREEAEGLLGRGLSGPDAMRAACAELARRHEVAIISDGSAGAWFARGDRVIHASSPPVNARSTTAAGDMLLAEFCAGYFPRRELSAELAARAVAAGAAAVERRGGPAMAPRGRVDELTPAARCVEY